MFYSDCCEKNSCSCLMQQKMDYLTVGIAVLAVSHRKKWIYLTVGKPILTVSHRKKWIIWLWAKQCWLRHTCKGKLHISLLWPNHAASTIYCTRRNGLCNCCNSAVQSACRFTSFGLNLGMPTGQGMRSSVYEASRCRFCWRWHLRAQKVSRSCLCISFCWCWSHCYYRSVIAVKFYSWNIPWHISQNIHRSCEYEHAC